MEKGMIYIYCGDGKGKSPIAFGRALQSACRGENVVIIRFMKGIDLLDSEYARRLEPEIKIFRFEKSDEDFNRLSSQRQTEEIINIRNGLNFAKKVMNTNECSLLILDEVLELLENGIITVDELKKLLLCKPDEMDIIMTGAACSPETEILADEITRVETIDRHAH